MVKVIIKRKKMAQECLITAPKASHNGSRVSSLDGS